MSASVFGRLELWFWALLPATITLLLVFFCLVPKHMVGLSSLSLPLYMMPMFFWGLHQPRTIPLWFAFALGLLVDVAQGLPLGLCALTYLVFRLLIDLQHKYIIKEGFVVKWGYFGLLMLGVGSVQWLVLGFITGQVPALVPAFIQLMLAICLYPVFHRLFDLLFEQASYRGRRIAHGR